MLRSGIGSDELPFLDFIDIWQNLTWIYKSFSILFGFIVALSMSQEFRYSTIKQQVVDGLSPQELIQSKIMFIIALSLLARVTAFVIGLITDSC